MHCTFTLHVHGTMTHCSRIIRLLTTTDYREREQAKQLSQSLAMCNDFLQMCKDLHVRLLHEHCMTDFQPFEQMR